MEKRLPDGQTENVPKEIPNRPNPDKDYPIKDPIPGDGIGNETPNPDIPDAEPGKDNPVNPENDEPISPRQ